MLLCKYLVIDVSEVVLSLAGNLIENVDELFEFGRAFLAWVKFTMTVPDTVRIIVPCRKIMSPYESAVELTPRCSAGTHLRLALAGTWSARCRRMGFAATPLPSGRAKPQPTQQKIGSGLGFNQHHALSGS